MGKITKVNDCEWEYIGEGNDPAEAAEFCADIGDRTGEEREKSGEEKHGEYWEDISGNNE